METDAEITDLSDPARNEETYEAVLKIEKLVRAAEMLADAAPALDTPGGPPIHYLLELARADLNKLARRVSP